MDAQLLMVDLERLLTVLAETNPAAANPDADAAAASALGDGEL